MDKLNQFQLSWLSEYASGAKSLDFTQLATPSLIFLATATLVFGFIFIRRHLPSLAYFNAALAVVVVSSFQACSTMGPGIPDRNPIGDSTPNPRAKDLKKYFGDRTYVFSPREKANTYTTQPDFEQYRVMLGIGNCDPSQASSACKYLSEWKTDDDFNSINDVWSALKACENGACFSPSSTKRLVLDLRLNPNDVREVPVITAEHGRPFPVLAYLLDMGPSPKIYILNPEHISYEIKRAAYNSESFVQNYEGLPGWFVGTFENIDETTEEISTKKDFVRLSAMQGDVNLKPTNEADLPGAQIMVWPEAYFPMMPEYMISPVLTDNRQALLRDGIAHGPVSVTGELSLESVDLAFPTMYAPQPLDIKRTYRSFNGSVDAFGRAWSASFLMRKEYYALNTPTGPIGVFEFLRTGEGRRVFLPSEDNKPGPFFPVDDPATPFREDAFSPDPAATRLLQTFDSSGASNARNNAHFDLNGRLISTVAPFSENRLFQFYDGGIRMLADHFIRMNSKEVFTQIISNFKNAETKFKLADYSGASAAARLNLGSDTQVVYGKMVYFFKNDKGMISGLIDQAGNMVTYTYNKDRIVEVKRIAYQNPKNEPAPVLSSPSTLFSYGYDDIPEDRNETWSALLKTASSPDRQDGISVTEWTPHDSLFGEAPVVGKVKVGPIELEFKYRFNFQNPVATSSTEVTDSLERKFTYHWDSRGYVLESWGPTESSDHSLLLERMYDPKNLRTVNVIARGIESFWAFESSGSGKGLLNSQTLCADRASPGDTTAVTAILGRLNASGEIENLQCESSVSRTTEYTSSPSWVRQEDFFKDLTGTLIPKKYKLPSSAQNSTERRFEMVMNCDSAGIAEVTNTATNAVMGSKCTYSPIDTEAPWKGKYGRVQSRETFPDGSYKLYASPQTPNLSPGAGSEYTISEDAKLPNPNTNQFGNFLVRPSLGYTSVYTPSGNRTLTASDRVFLDIYGNTVQRWGAWGEDQASKERYKYFFDYRKQTARLSGLLQQNRRPVDVEGTNFAQAGSLIGLGPTGQGIIQTDIVSHTGEKVPAFKAELRAAYLPRANWLVDERFSDDRSGPSLSVLADGTRIRREYDSERPHLLSDEFVNVRKRFDANEALVLTRSWKFDEFDRLKESTDVEGVLSKTIYRTNYDRGVDATEIDSTAKGGGKVTSRVIQRDWAGRPIEIQISSEFSDSIRDTLQTTYFEYDLFGEVSKTFRVSTPSNATSTMEAQREAATGIVLSTRTNLGGEGVDYRQFETIYSDFDSDLIPRKTEVKIDGVLTSEKTVSAASVFGKSEDVTIRGKTTINSPSLDKIYSRTRKLFDGCGNLVRQEDWVDSTNTQVTVTEIAYGNGNCLPAKTIDPSGWQKTYGYFSDGSVAVVSEYENPQYVPGQGGRFFNSSFTECSAIASGPYVGRCTGPGLRYNLEARIDPGTPNGGAGTILPILKSATATWNSPAGQPVQLKQYVDTGVFTDQNVIQALNATTGNSYGSAYRIDNSIDREVSTQTRGSKTVSLSQTEFDKGLGIAKRITKKRVFPYGVEEKVEAALTVSELDAFGRVNRLRSYNGICSGTSADGCDITESDNTLKSDLRVLNWDKGVATNATANLKLAGNINVVETRLNSLHPSSAIVSDSQVVREYNFPNGNGNYVSGGSTIIQVDGNAQPLSLEYVYSPPDGKDLMSFISKRAATRDLLGRVTSTSLNIGDQQGGATTNEYEVGDLNNDSQADIVARNRVDYANRFDVTTTYRDDGFTMTYGGATGSVTANYFLLKGDDSHAGRIATIVVTDPAGREWTYRPFGALNLPGTNIKDPYPASTSKIVGALVGGEEWYDPNRDETLEHFSVISEFRPYFRWSTQTPDLYFGVVGMNLKKGLMDSFNAYFADDLVKVGNTSESLGSSRQARLASANSDYSCDSTSAVGVDQRQRWSNVADPASQFVFNDRGQLNYVSKSFPGSTRLDISVENRFDSNNRLARSTEILRASNPGDSYFGANESGGKARILRYIDKAYYFSSVPSANFSDKEVLLKMNVVDRNSRSLASLPAIRNMSTQSSFEGDWLFVNATQGPIMGFHRQGDGSWRAYDFIYDRNGNIIMTREKVSGQLIAPTYREVYLPFLSSVITRYGTPTVQTNANEITGYMTEISYPVDQLDKPTHSSDPQMMPAPSLLGAMGAPRDILGNYYMGSTAYDSFTGSLVSLSPDGNDEVCKGGPGLVKQAQAMYEQRMARSNSNPTRIAPSIEAQALAVNAQEQAEKNLVDAWSSWPGRIFRYGTGYEFLQMGVNAISNKLVGTDVLARLPGESLYFKWVHERTGTQWFYEGAVGPGISGYTAMADQISYFIPVLGSARMVEEQWAEGTPLTQGLSIAGLAVDLVSFGTASRLSMLKTGSKYLTYTDRAAMGAGLATDGAWMLFDQEEE